jgi:hypothetical protein
MVGRHAAIIGDVVAVVAARRGIERQQPYHVNPEIDDIVEFRDQAFEVADAIAVAVAE